MNENSKQTFIVIDDDRINNMICSKIIGLTLPGCDVRTFISPEEGVEHLKSCNPVDGFPGVVLFLDINMPVLTGWDVLDKIDSLPDSQKKNFDIYMLSSSVDFQDREKADNHPLVLGYISKPLTREKILALSKEQV